MLQIYWDTDGQPEAATWLPKAELMLYSAAKSHLYRVLKANASVNFLSQSSQIKNHSPK